MILVMLAALYIVIALAFEIVISRYYGIVQAAIEMSLIVLLPGFGFFLLLFLHLDIFLFNLRKGSIEPEKGVCQEFCVNRFNKQHRIAA